MLSGRSQQGRRWPGRALLVFAGLVIGGLVGECLVRSIGYDGDHGRRGWFYDSPYGIVAPSNWIFRLAPDPLERERMEIRSQSFPVAKPPGETRVIFLGDSGTAGLFLDIEESFPMQFQALLDREEPGHSVRAINAGSTGMTTVGEYYLLRDKLLVLEPDAVILGLFLANDITFNLGHWERSDTRSDGWVDRATKHSALAHFLQLQALARDPQNQIWKLTPVVSLPLIGADGLHMLSEAAGEIATYKRESSEHTERSFEVLGNVLREFVELSEEHDFTFVIQLIPTRSTVAGKLDQPRYPGMLQELAERNVIVREEELDFDIPTQRVLGICEELGVLCLDPTARLRAIGLERAYIAMDEHNSSAGYQVIAQELVASRDRWLTPE